MPKRVSKPVTPLPPGGCVHHWVLSTSTGPGGVASGTCRTCGDERTFGGGYVEQATNHRTYTKGLE